MQDNFLDNYIATELKRKNNEERIQHKSSGKLSASMLGLPLQWQILKILGVESREIDDYTLRKFSRGKDVENWLMGYLPDSGKQKFVEYRNCVGYVDAVVDASNWGKDYGTIPLEVKSVANMKFKRIEEDNEADRSHQLQACLYALALQKPMFGVCYVASDDLRIKCLIYETEFVAPEVEKAIDAFGEQMAKRQIPAFEAKEGWQKSLRYNNYPLFAGLSEEELKVKSEELFKNIK